MYLSSLLNNFFIGSLTTSTSRGGFKGEGGGRTPPPPPSGIRPPADPKGPPFDTFSEIHFWPTDPKLFLRAPWAPIYTNFEGERAKKNAIFLSKFFKKCPKTAFFDCFFQKFACGAENLAKIGAKQYFGRNGRAQKINLVDLKKKKGRQNFGKFFENPPPPPRENPRSAPVYKFFFNFLNFFMLFSKYFCYSE